MKKLIMSAVILVLGLLSVESGAKDIGRPDDIQTQYIEQLKTIDNDILKLYFDQEMNDAHTKTQQQMELLEVSYRGRVPLELQIKRAEIEADQTRIYSETSKLEKNRETLKLDALKYYKGQMPKWLKNAWDKEMSKYLAEQSKKLSQRAATLGMPIPTEATVSVGK
jgi:hypothetical protein